MNDIKNEKVKITFATDDGINLSSEHFGSAKKYLVYELKDDSLIFDKKVKNITPEEEFHGDPNKAKSVRQLLNDVNIFIGFAMGPNITRMRKHVLPIISRIKDIEEIKKIILEKREEILENLNKETKPIIIIEKNNELKIVN